MTYNPLFPPATVRTSHDHKTNVMADGSLNGTPYIPSQHVVIERRLLNGWDNGKCLSGSDWRAFAESLPAGEFSTTLLFVADAIDKADGTGWYAHALKHGATK